MNEAPKQSFRIRPARESDAGALLCLIRELAEYEKLLDRVKATEEMLVKWLFREGKAEVALGELDGEAIGYVLFFTTFSSFAGLPGLYLEDLFVRRERRGLGYGTRLLAYVAGLMRERGYERLEWACLDWNQPSIDFYRSLGAERLDDWTTYRLTGEALSRLAD